MPSGVSGGLQVEIDVDAFQGMIWVVEKLILHHFIDMGYETVKIPIRVEVEYGLDGFSVTSLSKKTFTIFHIL